MLMDTTDSGAVKTRSVDVVVVSVREWNSHAGSWGWQVCGVE